MKYSLLVIIPTLLISCFPLEKTIKESYRSELYIDFKMVAFEGRNSTQTLIFMIDSTSSLRYYGKLIINSMDTLQIAGFEKGSFYPSWYQNKITGEKKMIGIWCSVKQAQIPDSLEISEQDTVGGVINEKTILYRQPRNLCN